MRDALHAEGQQLIEGPSKVKLGQGLEHKRDNEYNNERDRNRSARIERRSPHV